MAYYSNAFNQPYHNHFQQEHVALERLASAIAIRAIHVVDDADSSGQGAQFPTYRESVNDDGSTSELRCLPLLDVSVDVEVTSTISYTSLTQTFSNFSTSRITEAHYIFPLYDGATITFFKCSVGHDKILEGKVKPKGEARAEYKQAVAEQRVAALLEEHTPEVFETQLGNIPAKSVVKVEIQYVNELKVDIGGEGVLVTIPTSVAPRYGSPPLGYPSSTTKFGKTSSHGLSITVNITSANPIRKLESRSHPVSVEMGAPGSLRSPIPTSTFSAFARAASTFEAPPTPMYDPKKALAVLSDPSASLSKDFVLLILSSGSSLTESRALKEAPVNDTGEAAMMVTLCPRDLAASTFPLETFELFKREIIFIADRSGSMMGEKINTLKEALHVFLKSLPEKIFFNIYSFGNKFSSLWSASQEYTQQSLDAAMHHISNGFNADMGGTEILSAITAAFQRRIVQDNLTSQIIVLTDGEVWDEERLITFIDESRQKCKGAVRFFALGIGDSVSHRLIEGIGRQGGGYAEVVAADRKGKWAERVIRMLKGALIPPTWDCQIEIDEFTDNPLQQQNFQSPHERPEYIQAPCRIPSLHTFARQSVFFLFPQQAKSVPKTVTIKATAPSGETITTHLDIEETPAGTNIIHCLAARAAISDLETGKSWMHRASSNLTTDDASVSLDRAVRIEAERLGTLYKITGKWTSFVAVDNNEGLQSPSRFYKAQRSELSELTQPRMRVARRGLTRARHTLPVVQSASPGRVNSVKWNSALTTWDNAYQGMPLDHITQSPQSNRSMRGPVSMLEEPSPTLYQSDIGASLYASSQNNLLESEEESQLIGGGRKSLFCPHTNCKRSLGSGLPAKENLIEHTRRVHRDEVEDEKVTLQDLVALQTAEGSFPLLQYQTRQLLGAILGLRSLHQLFLAEGVQDIFDTLLVIRFMRIIFLEEKELWELMVQKAERWVKSQLPDGANLEALLDRLKVDDGEAKDVGNNGEEEEKVNRVC
jgi:hypothetical protein